MQHAQEGIGDEAVGDGVGVDHPPAARREQFDPAERVEPQELESHQQSAQHRSAHEDQGSHEMPVDQALVNQVAVARQFLFQGRFLTLVQIEKIQEERQQRGRDEASASTPGSVQAAGSVSRR